MTAAATVLLAGSARAQVTPAAGYVPPDDTPVIRVGATIFANYMFQDSPKATDADGNLVHPNSFDVARAYINITGNISHLVAFRITPDVKRETTTAPTLGGNLVFRTKYAYLQTNLDEWLGRGTFARFGIQQTPYLDSLESIYRYRFQGTLFTERTGYFASADAGASFRYNLPSNYGDFHVGVYNGENYDKVEPNDQKAIMARATIRPFHTGAPLLRGIKFTGFWIGDHYVKNAPRKRLIGNVTFEHTYVNAGFEYISAVDQTLTTAARRESHGYSIWATPKLPQMKVMAEGQPPTATGASWEMLLRYDHLVPNNSSALSTTAPSDPLTTTFRSQQQNRAIVGIAYWFPHPGGAPTAALLVDYDGQIFNNITTTPNKSVVLHALISF